MLTANRHEESWRVTGFDISKAVSVMVYDSQYFSLFLVGYGWWETSMFMQRWCRINLDHLLHMHLWQYVKISSWCIYPAQSHMAKVIVTCIHLLDTYETIIHVFRSNQFNTNGCWCPGPHIAKTTAAMLLTVLGGGDKSTGRLPWITRYCGCEKTASACFSENRASYQHIKIILDIKIAVVSWKIFSWVPIPAKNIYIETSFRLQCHILQLRQI